GDDALGVEGAGDVGGWVDGGETGDGEFHVVGARGEREGGLDAVAGAEGGAGELGGAGGGGGVGGGVAAGGEGHDLGGGGSLGVEGGIAGGGGGGEDGERGGREGGTVGRHVGLSRWPLRGNACWDVHRNEATEWR